MLARWAQAWLLSLGLCAVQAHAQAGPALHFVRAPGAEGCIAPARLAEAVENSFGGPVFTTASDAELAIEGYVAREAQGFRALLQVSDREGRVLGSRVLESPGSNCHGLDEALVLVVVLTLNPAAGLAGGGIALPSDVQARLDDALSQLDQAIETGQVPAEQAAPPSASTPQPPPPALPPREPLRRWSLSALGGPSFGAAPSLTWIAGLRAGFQPKRLPLFELSAFALGPSAHSIQRSLMRVPSEGDPVVIEGAARDTTAEVGAWSAELALSVCMPRGIERRVRVRLCGGLEGGLMRAHSDGFVHDAVQIFPLVSLAGAGVLELPLGRRGLVSLELGGQLPLLRPEFVYETAQGENLSVFLTSSVTGRLLLVLGLHLD